MKKFLSIILCLLLIISTIVLGVSTVSAEETNDQFVFSIMANNTIEITKYIGEDSIVEIPEKINGYTVRSIGNFAFENNEKITSVNISDPVRYIGKSAFLNCKNLKDITTPASISFIGSYAMGYLKDDVSEYIKTEEFTIHGFLMSPAMDYATSNSINFDSIGYVDPNPADKFIEKFKQQYDVSTITTGVDYNEIYYCFDEISNIDWAIVNSTVKESKASKKAYGEFGEFVIREEEKETYPWKLQCGIYDVDDEKFYDVVDVIDNPKYTHLRDILVEENIAEIIGDLDKDKRISIVDSTIIQQCLAELREFPANDVFDDKYECRHGVQLSYISDYNKDGSRDIVDVTEIQKHLAGIN